MNVFNIQNSFALKNKMKWEKLYVAIDAHGTLIKPRSEKIEFYPHAIDVLSWFNRRYDFVLILWTSSHENKINDILNACNNAGVVFNHINSNPSIPNNDLSCFDKKFYFNILIDDKAGFNPETDWELIKLELVRIGEWNRVRIGEWNRI